MTLNCRTAEGRKYLFKHGPFVTLIDGSPVDDVWYTDRRRGVAKRYVKTEDGRFKLTPDRLSVVTETIRAKSIKLVKK